MLSVRSFDALNSHKYEPVYFRKVSMVRRRMASPKPSPPVHRQPPSPISARGASTPVPTRAAPVAPTPSPQPQVAPPAQGTGLLGQMAATAGGVAIGSAVVSTLD